jgi:hypothetical protein
MKKKFLIAALVAVAVIGGASIYVGNWYLNRNVETTLAGLPALTYPGFQTWPTPRTFDGPGTVFQEMGKKFYSIGPTGLTNQNVGTEALVNVHTTGKWKGDVLAQFTGTGSGSFGIRNDQDIDLALEFEGSERWRVDALKLDDAIKAMKLPFSSGGKFYVVRESISVKRISYRVSFNSDAESDATAKVATVGKETPSIDGKITVKAVTKNALELKQEFARPHYVFYLASEIGPSVDLSNVFLQHVPASASINWYTETRPLRQRVF